MEKDPDKGNPEGQEAISPSEHPFDYLWSLTEKVGEYFHGKDNSIQIYKLHEGNEPGHVLIQVYPKQSEPGRNDVLPLETYMIEKDGLKAMDVRSLPSVLGEDLTIKKIAHTLNQRSQLEGEPGTALAQKISTFVHEQLASPQPPSEKEQRTRARAADLVRTKTEQGSEFPASDAYFETTKVLWSEPDPKKRDDELKQVVYHLSLAQIDETNAAIERNREIVHKYWDEKLAAVDLNETRIELLGVITARSEALATWQRERDGWDFVDRMAEDIRRNPRK